MQSTPQMVFWLVVVLLMIPASLWLLKRSGWAGRAASAASSAQVLQMVAQTTLGPGQKVVTIEVNAGGERTWLILGVTGQSISNLSQMPAPEATALSNQGQASSRMTSALPPAFAALLHRFQTQQPPSTVQEVV
jgi:flagellar protein FliO/FliZ